MNRTTSILLKYIGIPVLIFAAFVLMVGFQLNQSEKFFQFKFDGVWVPSVDPLVVGPNNYTTLKNLRYKDGDYLETVEGYTEITSSAISSGYPVRLHQFYKENENHIIAKLFVGSNGYLYENTTAIPGAGNFGSSIYTVSDGLGSFANGPAGVMFYVDDQYDLAWGGDEMRASRVFVSSETWHPLYVEYLKEYTDNVSNEKTSDILTIGSSGDNDNLLIASPYKLDGVSIYVASANSSGGSVTAHHWTGWTGTGGWTQLSGLSDGTDVSGSPLGQNGDITWTYSDSSKLVYINGGVYYLYRLLFSSVVSATIYQINMSAPIQEISDIWNQSGRTCISFQVDRDSVYEDWTFPVNDYSSTDSEYAAKVGGIDGNDTMVVMFDDRIMGLSITMLAGATNTDTAVINTIKYYDGDSYQEVTGVRDTTAKVDVFEFSGSITWDPVDPDDEQPQSIFGRHGYAYEIDLNGTLTDGTDHNGTMIDYIWGIAAPLKMSGYDVVGQYSSRTVLFDGNKMDYSRAGLPWVFNGVDTSNDGELSLYFGDDTPVTAVASLYNRYGSRIIESLIVGKQNETYLLTGSQPYTDYAEPFVIKKVSGSIGIPAPDTLRVVDIGNEVAQGDWRNGAIWLDTTGPVMFTGETIRRLEGIEVYTDSINIDYLWVATAYIDWTNREYNLLFATDAYTYNNMWVAYDLKRRKWYQKDPYGGSSHNPQITNTVVDEYGAKYNYGMTQYRYMYRLDHDQDWDGEAIDMQITTGEFTIPTDQRDPTGFWTFNELSEIKWLSNDLDEDENLTISIDYDGSNHSDDLIIDLNADGNLNYVRNLHDVRRVGAQGYTFQVDFQASSDTNKLKPLMWGFKAKGIRED